MTIKALQVRLITRRYPLSILNMNQHYNHPYNRLILWAIIGPICSQITQWVCAFSLCTLE